MSYRVCVWPKLQAYADRDRGYVNGEYMHRICNKGLEISYKILQGKTTQQKQSSTSSNITNNISKFVEKQYNNENLCYLFLVKVSNWSIYIFAEISKWNGKLYKYTL